MCARSRASLEPPATAASSLARLHPRLRLRLRRSWYPLGRPVGTTIYPGMQMTSVLLWQALKARFWSSVLGLKVRMSLNDVCVFVPVWFGAVATLLHITMPHHNASSQFTA